MYMYVYVYIYIEREREIQRDLYIQDLALRGWNLFYQLLSCCMLYFCVLLIFLCVMCLLFIIIIMCSFDVTEMYYVIITFIQFMEIYHVSFHFSLLCSFCRYGTPPDGGTLQRNQPLADLSITINYMTITNYYYY